MPSVWTHTALAQQIVFGAGSLRRLSDVVKLTGARKALLITTEGRLRSEEGARVTEALGRALASTFAEVESHVPVPSVQQAVLQARRDGIDLVVSFGGGSCADLGKAVCFFLEQEAGMAGASHVDRPLVPHISIPTTYSGAELTPFFGMTDPATRQKQGAGGPTSAPIAAIYDPMLTLSTPARVSAETGMNALAHCVEAAWSPLRTPEAEAIALAGARTIAAALPAVVADAGRPRGPHRDARGRLPRRPVPPQRRDGRAPRARTARRRSHGHPARPRQRRAARPRRPVQRGGGPRRGRAGRCGARRRGRCRRRGRPAARPDRAAGSPLGGGGRGSRPRGGGAAVAVEPERRPQPPSCVGGGCPRHLAGGLVPRRRDWRRAGRTGEARP